MAKKCTCSRKEPKKTRKEYEEYLNDLTDVMQDQAYYMPGAKMQYGTRLRKYDPTAFNVGFREWRPE